MCVYIFSTKLSEIFPTLRRTERDTIENIDWSSCKVTVILVRFLSILNYVKRLAKNTQVPNFMKIRPMGSELLHADGHDRVIFAFRNFANAPNKTIQVTSVYEIFSLLCSTVSVELCSARDCCSQFQSRFWSSTQPARVMTA